MTHPHTVVTVNGNRFELCAREHELYMHLIGTPDANKCIAHAMGLAEGSIKVMCSDLYTKIGVSGRLDLMNAEIIRLRLALDVKVAA